MRIATFCLLLTMYCSKALAQSPLNSVAFASPNAAQMGSFGQVKVDHFNGLPNISIPLYTAQMGALSLPLTLSYHGGGIKKEERPTWVGLGWNLGVGGVITRKANGKIDEYYYAGDPYIPNPEHYSFLYNKDKLLGDAWVTNNEGNPGELDLAPDEFQFTVNGLSGTFFMDGNGKLLVKTAANEDIKVDYELKNSPELANFYYPDRKANIPRIFYKFTLTAADGTKYVFGNDKDAIEYSRSSNRDRYLGGPSIADIPPGDGSIVATSWYLKEIVSPTGKTITFSYVRNGYQMIESRLFRRGRHSHNGCSDSGNEDLGPGTIWSRNLINSVYLKSITGYEGTTVHFETSESNQLSQGQPIDGNGETFFEGYYDLLFSDPSLFKNKMLQLDKVLIKYNGVVKKQVKFEYTSAATERLKLLNVHVTDNLESFSQRYVFGYHPAKLPAYNTGQSDHWGYYNKDAYFFDVNSFTADNASALYPSYLTYLEPDASKAQAEILTSITYPTGGQTSFKYELNNYSSQVAVTAGAFAVEDLLQNKNCGGLRIAEIISDPLNSGVPLKKVYKYVKDYASNGTASSGILTGKPDYWVSGAFQSKGQTSTGIGSCTIDNEFWMFNSQGYEPLSNSNGSHIGYSEVAEVNADGSYTVYKYSNYNDPQYVDQFPVNLKTSFDLNATSSLFFKTLCFTKMGFERGLLLKKLTYNNSGNPKQEVIYTYNNDPARYANYGRAVETYHLPLVGAFTGTIAIVKTVSCTKKYLFNPNVTKIETKTYEPNGTITSTEELKYNAYRNVSERTLTNSIGEVIKEEWRYPVDFTYREPFQAMVNQHILSPVVEQKMYNNNVLLQATRTSYRHWGNGFFAPLLVEGKRLEYPYEEKIWYTQYDENGNVVQTAKGNDLITSYLWGYNKSLPIAKTTHSQSVAGLYMAEQKYDYLPVNAPVNKTSFITPSFGEITLQIETNFWEHNFFVDCVLTSADGTTYTRRLCKGTVDFCGYAGPPTSVSFTVPAGSYTLQVTPSRSLSDVSIKYSYRGHTTTIPSYALTFYEGFEEVADAATATPFAGKKYHQGDYTIPYSETYSYYVDYRYLEGGVWKYKKKPVPSNKTLTDGEAIDEVRVYPIKSLMTTYTYDPLVGMTSETDPNGRTLFYEYDGLGRLSQVRDEKRNILKKYCYNYAGQVEDCSSTHLVGNAVQRQTFTRSDCGTTGTGEAVTYTIPAGTYFGATQPEADQKALNDIALNGQVYANRVGKCLSSGYQNVDVSGYYTRNNCPAGQESIPLYVTVGAGMFTSTLSQPDADNRAKEYAQSQANANGACTSTGIKLYYENDTPQEYGVTIYTNDGTTWYEFTIPAATPEKYTGVLGSVPPGIYNVAIWTINGQWLFRDFEYCGNFMSGTSEAYFFDVEINSSCSTIKTSRTY